MGARNTLTLKGAVERTEAKRLYFADGRYVTRGHPRAGGLASVYRATDTETGDTVALKVLRSGDGTDEVIEESFRREVQALSDLKHPNIVRILNSGREGQGGDHYIVMEWLEKDLKTVFSDSTYKDWTSYYQSVGKGVLDALVFAHSRSTAHRDIKPTNILVTDDGVVKLCDFGISKIRNFLTPGVTLNQFASAPFSPPEVDDGSYSYSRDVFGFAALSVAALSGRILSNYEELFAALEDVTVEESIRRTLRKCLTREQPSARPTNAVMLKTELEAAVPLPIANSLPLVLVLASQNVRKIVEYDMALRGSVAERFIERDLDGARGEEVPPNPDRPGQQFHLYGGKYSYVAVRDVSGAKLVLVHALEFQPSDIDRRRSNAADLGIRFGLTGTSNQASSAAIEGFLERLVTFTADQKHQRLEFREQALYRTWIGLLSAKTDLEKMRSVKVPYVALDASGEFVRLVPRPESNAFSLVDKDVLIQSVNGGGFRGRVISVSDSGILVRPSERNRVEASALPDEGVVETDTTKSDTALDKQKAAVDAVRYGRSVNAELGAYIVSPDRVEVPVAVEVNFFNENLDDDKKDAVTTAVSGPALLLIEGPPGTGKTTLITELVLQTLKEVPNARVLLTSQTHVALDNSLERIMAQSHIAVNAVRVGQESNDRIAQSVRTLLLDAKLPEMRRQALASGRAYMESWAVQNELSLKEIRRAMALERHSVLKTRLEETEVNIRALDPQLGEEYGSTLSAEEKAAVDDQYQGLSQERDDLERALKESMKEMAIHVDSKEELKEFSECSAEDLRQWAEAYSARTPAGAQLQKLLSAHADWEARFGRSREFKAAVIAASQVVAGTCIGVMNIPGSNDITYDLCIVDEASIATPTEVLVPMARARRTVVVGDSKQLSPFQDSDLKTLGLLEKYDLTPDDQKYTLFNHLSQALPVALKKTLSTQHRMLPAIGNLISDCFYGGELSSVDRKPDERLSGVMPRPVTWYSTSRKPNRASRSVGTSHFNDAEIEVVINLLGRIDFFMQKGRVKGKPVKVALLTGYEPQRQRLQTAVQTKCHAWVSFEEIFVNVVDAFQGREADILVFSVTRSEARGLGFLREMERINVALSRGRELLAIVGDHAYCQSIQGAINPLRDVIDYIRRNPATCALEELQP